MAQFLSLALVEQSFRRLLSRRRDGKTHLERTSALMYFLAFDAACRRLDKDLLDFDPEKNEGIDSRKQIEIEFINLVLIDDKRGQIKQVLELGKIGAGETPPEKRISSNFLTVPLKKASESAKPYFYPKRPSPLLNMGLASTGLKWGVRRHESWAQNIPMLFSEIKESTPFLDTAIFALRHSPIDGAPDNLLPALTKLLDQRFTKDVSVFWSSMIEKEKVLARHIGGDLFSPSYQPLLTLGRKQVPPEGDVRFDAYDKEALKRRVVDLEYLLDLNNIQYEKNF